jgi:hypothetical protein
MATKIRLLRATGNGAINREANEVATAGCLKTIKLLLK